MLHFIHKDETTVAACGFKSETSDKEGCCNALKFWCASPSVPLHASYGQTPAAITDFPPEYPI